MIPQEYNPQTPDCGKHYKITNPVSSTNKTKFFKRGQNGNLVIKKRDLRAYEPIAIFEPVCILI